MREAGPGIGVQNGAIGALILAIAFLVGVQWGPTGMGVAWIAAYPLYLGISAWRTLPVIGVAHAGHGRRGRRARRRGGFAMALIVGLVDPRLPPLDRALAAGDARARSARRSMRAWMLVFARSTVRELIAIARKQPRPA